METPPLSGRSRFSEADATSGGVLDDFGKLGLMPPDEHRRVLAVLAFLRA